MNGPPSAEPPNGQVPDLGAVTLRALEVEVHGPSVATLAGVTAASGPRPILAVRNLEVGLFFSFTGFIVSGTKP